MKLLTGQKYKIVYQSDTQRYAREAVMVYLGESESESIWSLRPVAGTQTMPKKWIRSIAEASPDAKVYLGRRAAA